jgi:hypothetical protein
MFSAFDKHNLLTYFPKSYLRQDSLAVSELSGFVSDEYFEPSMIEVVHKEELSFNGKQGLFFVIRFQEGESGLWYRGVSGPYTPGKLSIWADATGSNFEEWDENDDDHSSYLRAYLKDFEN